MERRALVNHAANGGYLTVWAAVDEKIPPAESAASVCEPVRKKGE